MWKILDISIIILYEFLAQEILVQEICFKISVKYTFGKMCCMETSEFLKCFPQKFICWNDFLG